MKFYKAINQRQQVVFHRAVIAKIDGSNLNDSSNEKSK